MFCFGNSAYPYLCLACRLRVLHKSPSQEDFSNKIFGGYSAEFHRNPEQALDAHNHQDSIGENYTLNSFKKNDDEGEINNNERTRGDSSHNEPSMVNGEVFEFLNVDKTREQSPYFFRRIWKDIMCGHALLLLNQPSSKKWYISQRSPCVSRAAESHACCGKGTGLRA